MPDKVIYTLVVPVESQTKAGEQQRRNQTTQAVLEDAPPTVESVSTDPSTLPIEATFRGKYSDVQIRELVELFGSSTIEEVPYYTDDTTVGDDDGYYTLKSIDHKPADPRGTNDSGRPVTKIHPFTATLTRSGTRQSMWRAIKTGVWEPDNPWGNDLTAYVGIPSTATKVRWFDNVSKTEQATVVASRAGQFGTIDVYDAKASSFDNPSLIYTLPYQDEGDADTRVWDDYGRSKTDADGVVTWAHVYDPQHEFVGKPIAENGLVRVGLDDTADIEVWDWDDANSTYSSVTLGTSSWELYDTDLTRCGDDRVDGQLIFEDTSSSGVFHTLNMSLDRGLQWPMFHVPENESSNVPQGLIDKLDPVADTSTVDASPNKTVISRSDTRK